MDKLNVKNLINIKSKKFQKNSTKGEKRVIMRTKCYIL